MKKDCDTCRHFEVDFDNLPCSGCRDFEKWEAMTNADHIRSLSDEELAGFLSPSFSCYRCPARPFCEKDDVGADCNELVANWLKQPYKEE